MAGSRWTASSNPNFEFPFPITFRIDTRLKNNFTGQCPDFGARLCEPPPVALPIQPLRVTEPRSVFKLGVYLLLDKNVSIIYYTQSSAGLALGFACHRMTVSLCGLAGGGWDFPRGVAWPFFDMWILSRRRPFFLKSLSQV